MKLGVINYGMGNLGSVITAVKNLGYKPKCVFLHWILKKWIK